MAPNNACPRFFIVFISAFVLMVVIFFERGFIPLCCSAAFQSTNNAKNMIKTRMISRICSKILFDENAVKQKTMY